MDKDRLKDKLLSRDQPLEDFGGDDLDDVEVVSVKLPKLQSHSKRAHRAIGFWPDLMDKCSHLPVNQAVKVKLLPDEQPNNFSATARAVAKAKGFYLNTVYKFPYMYLWPDRIRGKVLPEDFNSKGAVFFENEEEVK